MTKASRRKGKAYENHIATLFREAGWSDAKRHLEFQGQEAEAGRDLDGTQPFAIQAKCWKRTPSVSAIEQIECDEEYFIPIAILKRQSVGGTPLEVAVVPLNIFLDMIGTLNDMIEAGHVAYWEAWKDEGN